jgi:hypothetical protein
VTIYKPKMERGQRGTGEVFGPTSMAGPFLALVWNREAVRVRPSSISERNLASACCRSSAIALMRVRIELVS